MITNYVYLLGFVFFTIGLLFLPVSLFAEESDQNWTQSDSIFIQNLVDFAWYEKTLDVQCAIESANEVILLSKDLGYHKGLADGLHTMGVIHWSLSDLPNALNYLLEALDVRLEINDSLGLGRSYNNIGNLYFDIAQFNTALAYYENALNIRKSLKDTSGLIHSLSNIGNIHLKNENLKKAYRFYKRSEHLAIQCGNLGKLSHAKGKLGDYYLKKGYPIRARLYWKESLKYAEKSADNRQIANSICKITELALRAKNTDLAAHKAHAHQALLIAREIRNISIQGDAVLLLAEIAKAQGNFIEASKYKQEYQILMSTIWVNQEAKAMAEVKTNFESRKYTKELIKNEELLSWKLSRLWLLLLLISCIFIVILIINYRKRYAEQSKLMETIRREMQKVADKNMALQQSNEVLEKFAFAASHDLKEPLRNIGAFTDLLNRRNKGSLTEESEDYIQFILNATRQMHQVLDDLLDYAKLTHPPSRDKQPLDISIPFNNWIKQNDSLLQSRNIDIEIGALPTIRVYSNLMTDLINHLLNNAIKFHTHDAEPRIKIDHEVNKHFHIFSIQDNGIGIDPVYQEKIFEVFQRLNKRDFSGTGMGLALCKRIIEHHNGQIWLKSKEGYGSCFYFSVKRHSSDIIPEAPNNKRGKGTKFPTSFMRMSKI